jgi:hypothetical protein
MSDSFVPLFAKGPNGNEPAVEFSRLKLRTAPAAPAALPRANPTPAAPATPVEGQNCQSHAAPKVTLQKEGEKVTGIKIECSCGQIILLDCVY